MPPVWTDPVPCPAGAALTGYPGYYPWGEAHLGDYLVSTHKPTACARLLKDQGVTPEG